MSLNKIQTYPVGSTWATYHGDKCIILAHDFVNDSTFAFNYHTEKTFRVKHDILEDNIAFRDTWDKTVAFEKGLFQGLYAGFDLELTKAFDVAAHEKGQNTAVYHWVGKGSPHDSGECAEVYGEYFLKLGMVNADKIALTNAMQSFVQKIRFDIEDNKVTKIVWRVEPEMDLQHDEITGNRILKMYARFVAFSHETVVPFEKFHNT